MQTIRDIEVPSWRTGGNFPVTETRAAWLATMAKAQAEAGDAAGAKASFAIAAEDAKALRDAHRRNDTLREIAEYQAQAGFVADAIETARGIEEEGSQAGPPRRPHRLRTARDIEEEGSQARAFSAIAVAQAEAGDVADAIETARGIEDEESRARAFDNITVAQAEAGDIAAARLSAGGRYFPLSRIIEIQIANGDFPGARQSAREIEDARHRAAELVDIAGAEAKAGQLAGAIAAAREIEDAFSRARALSQIAQAQAAAMRGRQ